MVVICVILFGLAGVATLHLKHVGERGVEAERDLQSVASELHVQDALEWRAISGRVAPGWVQNQLMESRARALLLLGRARDQGLSESGRDRLIQLGQRYTAAIDHEVRLLAAGDSSQAEAVDQAEVDPAFVAVQDALTGYRSQVSSAADRARRLSDLGIVLIVGLALLVTTGLQARRRLAEARREQERRSEAHYQALVDRSADMVAVVARDGAVQYLSPSAVEMIGPDLDRPVTISELIEWIHPADRELLILALAAADAERAPALVELRVLAAPAPAVDPAHSTRPARPARRDGDELIDESSTPNERIFEVTVQDLTADPAVRGLVLTGHDVTDRHGLLRELEHRALHDILTGLPNRALLADRLDQALVAGHRHGTATGLLLIDLDRFKEINDTLGHSYGDQLLTQVGPRLAGALRAVDTVARLGGDEFAVLLPQVSGLDAAIEVANKLQAALERSFEVEGVDLDVEASIGVVVSGEHGSDSSTLLQRADIAMYAAKQRTLGIASYDPDADSHTIERLALLGHLRRALNNDELFLHYQPKISLKTGEVCGAEALLRWRHPERGLIPPDGFIPLAENTGLIGPLTAHVLDLALAQARRWVDQDAPLQIAVNLSGRNLLDEDFDQVVDELLTRHGVASGLLKLEITESAVITDPVGAADLLQRLAVQGIDISIDDFGAGYTSIGQLRNLPISELKVDRSFVTGMEHDPSNSLIVRSVIELGHNLGMSSVAEGVESLATLDRLAEYECDVAQGFYISQPLPADGFERWRADWRGLPDLETRRPELPQQSEATAALVAAPTVVPEPRGARA
jgi:diguanylate cyclase (GGDEF)-like protein